jgi:hypothetical protein
MLTRGSLPCVFGEGPSEQAGLEDEGFDLAAAGLRADGADVSTSIEVLASKLEDALPGRTRVERRGRGLFGRERHVRDLSVQLGTCCYRLTVVGDRLEGSRERTVGGISIKRESLEPSAWIAALQADLRDEAERSTEARLALEKLLG